MGAVLASVALTTIPALGQSPGADAPVDFSQWSLANGAELIVVPDPSADGVTLNVLFRGGTSADPPRLAGLASLTAQILTHSTRNRTREELSGDLNRMGAEIGAAAGPDYTTVSRSPIGSTWRKRRS